MDKIDYAERKAEELFRHHIADMEALNKEAHQTFAFAVILLSGSFSYLLKLYDPTQAPIAQRWVWLFPVLALTVHLGVAATYLLYRAMMAKDVQPPGQLPSVLLGENAPHQDNFEELRKAELWSMADRIEKNRQRNRRTGTVINRTRRALLVAPLTFFLAWVLAEVVAGLAAL